MYKATSTMNKPINLTGRQLITQELIRQIESCKNSNTSLGVLFIKLRDLRAINESFGMSAGDKTIEIISSLLSSITRPEDFVVHISGGQFGLILPHMMNVTHTILAANRILSLCEEPFNIDKQKIPVQINIGISLFPEHSNEAEWLLQHAENAAASARTKREPIIIYEKSTVGGNNKSLIIKRDLDIAIKSADLEMHYQPQIDLQTRQVCGVEALIRWPNPVQGYISPALFIPIAEESNTIVPLTLWTVNTSIRQFIEYHSDLKKLTLAINMSAAVLNSTDIVQQVSSALNIWGLAPENLCLEVTESAIMVDPTKSMKILNQFNDMGINLSIDDFGTGYSSMAYLKRLPVKELKIDQTFITNMLNNEDDQSIVRSTIDLAHNFNLHVVAEGIEDEDTLEALAAMGCDRGQGFYMARPMPTERIFQWLKSSPWA